MYIEAIHVKVNILILDSLCSSIIQVLYAHLICSWQIDASITGVHVAMLCVNFKGFFSEGLDWVSDIAIVYYAYCTPILQS